VRAGHARRLPGARDVLLPAAIAAVGLGLGYGSAALWSPFDGATTASVAALPAVTPAASSGPGPTPTATGPAVATADPAPVASPSPSFDTAAHSLTDPGSIWVVVNKLNPLDPIDYEPADLVTVGSVPGGVRLREEAADALAALYAAADAEGAGFSASTAYRDHAFQASLYSTYVGRSGEASAERYSARAGHSEHQTGLAVDIHSEGCRLEACFGDTAAGRYVAEHAWEHGFIVRYPEDAEGITGYIHESWHLRYVGFELAAEMRERGVATMEEFFGLDPAPDYD